MKTSVIFSSRAIVIYSLLALLFNCVGVTHLYSAQKGPKGFNQIIGEYKDGISCITSTDELILIAPKDSNQVIVLDAESGQPLGILKGHTEHIEAIAISSGNDLVASIDEKGLKVLLWDFKKFEIIKSIESPAQITALAFAPDGKELAAGGADGTVSIFDLSTGETIRHLSVSEEDIAGILTQPPYKIQNLEISPLGRYLAAQESGGSVLVWDLVEEESFHIYIAPPYKLRHIQFSADERYLLATGGLFSLNLTLPGLSGKKGTITLTKVGGVVLLLDLNGGESYSASTNGMIFEQAFFAEDGEKVIVQASVPPADEGIIVRRILVVYPIESILEEQLAGQISTIELGYGAINQSSSFCKKRLIFSSIYDNKLYTWLVR